ncbi:hypothetical protein BABINDRAFT_163509 [Babjeviella inositovora NRRL Y-12698]|uniref:Histone H2A/H2B/H3 domain-containing protein n=1 Tax=Babjeviella inositovora NRRL Y-12698 TaxID=984486 RepID=A0A1E3QIM5_9ASCO|nr:uncharacterized protein BABINDRAFT_163509 [Babjeviella inositovora NRRL Y-12698]ODQ77500.1 hypothetical protein BABINDRAFT_163509 [Babjeviella inositovora NRRL Y-12698]
MAPSIPKSKLNRVIKSKTSFSITNADSTTTLVYLNYLTYMKELLREASAQAADDGASEVMPIHLKKANLTVSKRFQG